MLSPPWPLILRLKSVYFRHWAIVCMRWWTITDTEILLDPNIDKEHLPSGYRPITKEVKTTIKRGSYTSQKFSGEWTLRQKQLVQERISKLLNAVIEATKTVNDTPTMEPNLAADKLLGYIFYGTEWFLIGRSALALCISFICVPLGDAHKHQHRAKASALWFKE